MSASRPGWLELDARHCWHPYTQHATAPEPLPVAGASGAWLTLADGTRMLDAIASWWCCLHGHGQPELVAALAQQAQTLDHVLFAGCTHEPAAELSRKLSAAAPGNLTRAFYSDNGSTAVEVALKAAYQRAVRRGQAHRTTFLALEGGYHGDTLGAMAVGDPQPFFVDYAPLMTRVVRSPLDRGALEAIFRAEGESAAALILEPGVQGAAGMRLVPDELVRAARRLCDEYDVMLIADEVFTGFGRTGVLFACEHAGVVPDALCLSKGLTGGMLPLAVTLFPEAVFDEFHSAERAHMFFHGHTYTANPLACAVALASLELVRTAQTPVRLDRIGVAVEEGLALRVPAERVAIRRLGGIVAAEVTAGDAGYLSGMGDALRAACLSISRDVLLRPLGNVLYAVPPAATTPDECSLIAQRMGDVLTAALART